MSQTVFSSLVTRNKLWRNERIPGIRNPWPLQSSRLTQKLQDTSQDLVAAHGNMDLVFRHQEGNQHGNKEAIESTQALKET